MKVLIIEDESINANRLKRLLEELEPSVELLGVIDTVADSIEWLQANPMPELITMDIRLADGISFSIFDKVSITCPIIFTTAYDEYAIQAFKLNSIDYLMKPIEKAELAHALMKFKSIPKSNVDNDLANVLKNLVDKRTFRQRFLVSFRDGYKSINVSDIDFIYSEFKITHLSLKNNVGSIAITQTMEELEQELDPEIFFRANRQFFIRVESIKSISNYFNAKLKIELKNDSSREVIISREKAPFFKQWMDR